MDAQAIAEQIASVLDTLCEQDWDQVSGKKQRVALQAIHDLDKLYQQLWRENTDVPTRWWTTEGTSPAVAWRGTASPSPTPKMCPNCGGLLSTAYLGVRWCQICDYRINV